MALKKSELYSSLWSSCDELRGGMDASQYKDYVVRFRIHKDLARTKGIVWPRFSHPGFFAKPEHGLPGNFIATMGMPVTAEGRQEDGDLTLAARNAVIRMIELLEERGWTREQAYVLCSVAVDLRVSNVVDVPNVTVSALLPEGIFAG